MTPPKDRSGGGDIPLPGLPGDPGAPDTPAGSTPRSVSGAELPHMLESERNSAGFRERAFEFITGRKSDGALEGNRQAQMIAAFGSSSRDPSRPDVAAAAKAMKVSPRSVQRWLAGGGMSRAHSTSLTTRSRQAMTTKRGRAAAIRATGDLTAPRGRNAIRVGGDQGVVSSSDGNYRPRETKAQVSPADLQLMQEMWVEHGEAGMDQFLHQHFDQNYYAGWHFRSVDDLSWDTSSY